MCLTAFASVRPMLILLYFVAHTLTTVRIADLNGLVAGTSPSKHMPGDLKNNVLIPQHFCEFLIDQNDHKQLQNGKQTPSELAEGL